jgi:hypothetical protein
MVAILDELRGPHCVRALVRTPRNHLEILVTRSRDRLDCLCPLLHGVWLLASVRRAVPNARSPLRYRTGGSTCPGYLVVE